jgi:hypothetical protein
MAKNGLNIKKNSPHVDSTWGHKHVMMHKFDCCAWRKIKEYLGVYNVKGVSYKFLSPECQSSSIKMYICSTYTTMRLGPESSYSYINIMPMFKLLERGYKSREFYEKMAFAYSYDCPCCGGGAMTWGARYAHSLQRKHINALKSKEYDSVIIAKYNEDPNMFKWLDYWGFRLKLRGRKRRLVSGFGKDRHVICLN